MPSLLHRQAEAGRHRRSGRALRAPLRTAGQEVADLPGSALERARVAKLVALAGRLDRVVALEGPTVLPGGAAGLSATGQAVVLIDDGMVGRFGPALAWARRAGAVSLDVIVDGSPLAPSVVARRAACFAQPARVWSVAGHSAVPADASGDADRWAGGGPPAQLRGFVQLLRDHGLEVVWEHGVLRGEVLGLEVARTVGDRLEVGVGRHDRLARMAMRPSEPASVALASAADAVRARRRPGAAPHPANTLARSRWLRSVLVADPSAVGCVALRPVAPPLPWFDLPEAGAAPAIGLRDGTGGDGVGVAVVVVCCVGVDLDLVPTAADSRLAHAPAADLLVVVPAGDDVAITRELAAALERPATVVTVADDWASKLEVDRPVDR